MSHISSVIDRQVVRNDGMVARRPRRSAMETELRRVLRKHSRSLTKELAAELTSRSTPHYREIDPSVPSARCRTLVEALIRSTYLGPEQLGEYVSTIAEGWLTEGFEPEELQRALRILETKASRVVANESSVDSLRANLTALNTTIGYARDELGRVSQAHAYAECSGTGSRHLSID
jgi:hypothetical protein